MNARDPNQPGRSRPHARRLLVDGQGPADYRRSRAGSVAWRTAMLCAGLFGAAQCRRAWA